jgi:hypothetical protein
MTMLQVRVLESLPFQTVIIQLILPYCLSVCLSVSPLTSSVEPADRLLSLKEFTRMNVTLTL